MALQYNVDIKKSPETRLHIGSTLHKCLFVQS